MFSIITGPPGGTWGAQKGPGGHAKSWSNEKLLFINFVAYASVMTKMQTFDKESTKIQLMGSRTTFSKVLNPLIENPTDATERFLKARTKAKSRRESKLCSRLKL